MKPRILTFALGVVCIFALGAAAVWFPHTTDPVNNPDTLANGGPFGEPLDYGTTISLSIAEPDWSMDLSSRAAFHDDLWAATGESNDEYDSDPSFRDTGEVFYDPASIQLGRQWWMWGGIAYHFHTDDLFDGGTATVNLTSNTIMYLQTTDELPQPHQTWRDIIVNADYETVVPADETTADHTVAIPAGTKDFWLVIKKNPSGQSGKNWVFSVDVAATVILDPDGCVTPMDADLDNNCVVNLADFTLLTAEWLQCNDPDNPAQCY